MTPRTMNTIGVVNTALSPAAQVEAYAITVKVQCVACVLLSLLPENLWRALQQHALELISSQSVFARLSFFFLVVVCELAIPTVVERLELNWWRRYWKKSYAPDEAMVKVLPIAAHWSSFGHR